PGGGMHEIASAALQARPAPLPARATDLLLDGLTATVLAGCSAGAPALSRALRGFRHEELPAEGALRGWGMGCPAPPDPAGDEDEEAGGGRRGGYGGVGGGGGALIQLPLALSTRAGALLWSGRFDLVAALIDEVDAVDAVMGVRMGPYAALSLAAMRGREA